LFQFVESFIQLTFDFKAIHGLVESQANLAKY